MKLLRLYEKMLSIFEVAYKCLKCNFVEQSQDLTPEIMMQGVQATCSRCGGMTEAIWSHTTLPTNIIMPSSYIGQRTKEN